MGLRLLSKYLLSREKQGDKTYCKHSPQRNNNSPLYKERSAMKAKEAPNNLQKQPDVLMSLSRHSVQAQVLPQQRPRCRKNHQDFMFQIRAYGVEASLFYRTTWRWAWTSRSSVGWTICEH